MKRVVIIQARMTSTRLAGKVLANVSGKPMLAQQIDRLQRCALVDDIVIATTTNASDDPIVELARQIHVSSFRGSEQDVLARFVGAAKQIQADVVVRLTADCPLIDATVTDRIISTLIENATTCDYASNVLERSYPRGMDVEALFYDTLLRVERLAQSQSAREHVTPFIYSEKPELFLRRSVIDRQNNADLRWTVDTAADLELIRTLYQELDLTTHMRPYPEILAYVRANPRLSQINAGVETWTPKV